MVNKIGKALVVGAGISGIRSALDLAETGYGVTLIDRAPHIGGVLSQLDYQFPSNGCGMCKMLPLVQRDSSSQYCLRKGLFHENIDIRLSTEITGIEGEPGNFVVSLRQKPAWIDPDLCIGCGHCVDVCPVEVSDSFNAGLALRKAVYLPVPHTIPNPYVIDMTVCTNCRECEKVCPTDAVRLPVDQRKVFRILVVDDEMIVRESLKEWLVDEEFDVESVDSGQAALDRLGQATFHLMLADIKMPGMDGVELLRKSKEANPDLCVLMMTAYATVETAVEAMKIGALDYLIKPFDPDVMIPKILKVYTELEASRLRTIEVGAIVLCGGTDFFDPADEKNVYGYGTLPSVITSIEYERIISGTGPCGGQLVRPHDGKPVQKIAWLQCVGSRDLQSDADFCSSICCMISVKEAVLARERYGDSLETAIFYMDMRALGKSFQRYRDRAEADYRVRFERSRVHSITPDDLSGDAMIRYVRSDGRIQEETFDLVVLAAGQRPASGTQRLAEMNDIDLNRWGFIDSKPFAPTGTSRQGVYVGGAFSGLKDIGESVIHACAASLEASRVIHNAGGGLAVQTVASTPIRDIYRETPRILVAVCNCGSKFSDDLDPKLVTRDFEKDPYVDQIFFIEHGCTRQGWDELIRIVSEHRPNRILIGACHPYLYVKRLRELGRLIDLDASLIDAVDIMSSAFSPAALVIKTDPSFPLGRLRMALSRIKNAHPKPVPKISVTQKALVVGGGISGMHAALAVADHGFPVVLVERGNQLGGNLHWLSKTIEGLETRTLLDDCLQKTEKHPNIDIYLDSTVTASFGEVGNFYSTIETSQGTAETIEHGVVILATGGSEAVTESYGFGSSPAIVTQKKMEQHLTDQTLDVDRLNTVVMIQCVDSREEPRNYCSRVCCSTSIKHALMIKKQNPEVNVYILYRDIMTPGFVESYYTEARQAGVIFIQYDVENKPTVTPPTEPDEPIWVATIDPLLDRRLEIEADLVVLATGIFPVLPAGLTAALGTEHDRDGFFTEAESKWRPVDSIKEGIFACGLALSPRSIIDSIATAGAAAQRSLRILSHEMLPSGKIVAGVRHSLCSLCERCIEACPYGARAVDPNQGRILINSAMCQGCGECATVCPNSAAVLEGYREEQVLNMIDAALLG